MGCGHGDTQLQKLGVKKMGVVEDMDMDFLPNLKILFCKHYKILQVKLPKYPCHGDKRVESRNGGPESVI